MASHEQEKVKYPWFGLRVLIADDVSVSVDVMRNMLVSFGLVVDVVYRGDEALRRLTAQKPTDGYALVFLDIYMPGLSGLEVVSRFRASAVFNATTLPIIGMSSDAEPLLVERAHAAGMKLLLLKPIVRQMLRRVLSIVFDVGHRAPSSTFPSPEARLVFLESESRGMFTLAQNVLGAKRLTEQMFNVIPHACYLKSAADSRYLRVNQAFAQKLGLDRLAVIGSTPSDLVDVKSAKVSAEHDRQTLAAFGPVSFTESVRIRDAVRTLQKTQAVVEGDDGRRYIMGFVRDMTDELGARQEKDEGARTLARGLRTPLQVIADVIELIRQDGKATTRKSCASLLEGALGDIRRQLKEATAGGRVETKKGKGGRS